MGNSVPVDESSLDQQQSDERLAAEGYHFYAQEASEFAAASLQAVSEGMLRNKPAHLARIPGRSPSGDFSVGGRNL